MSEDREGEVKDLPKLVCPPLWTFARLADIADVQLGKTPGKVDYRNAGNCKIVKYRDLCDDGEITWTNAEKGFVEHIRARALNLRQLAHGDVLISASAHSSEIIGRKVLHVRELPNEFDSIYYVGEILCIRVAQNEAPNLARLVSYFFKSANGYKSIQAKVHGVHLIASRAEEMVVPVPPKEAQARIVSKIDELLSRIEVGERLLKQVLKLVERYRQSVLKAAVTGELTREWRDKHEGQFESGEALLQRTLKARREAWEKAALDKMKAKNIKPTNDKWKQKYLEPSAPDTTDLPDLPNGWTWATLDQFAAPVERAIQSGPFGSNLLHSEFQASGKLVIGIDNVREGWFSPGSQNRISDEKFEQLRKYRARPGDFLITVMATVGRTCVLPDDIEPAIITKHVYRFTLDQNLVLPEFVNLCVLGSPTVRGQMFGSVQGQTRPGLNKSILVKFGFPLPPIDEQRIIVDRVEQSLSELSPTEAAVESQRRLSGSLRQAVLRSAFSGSLVVQSDSDEPASVLLQRITHERSTDNGSAVKLGRKNANEAAA